MPPPRQFVIWLGQILALAAINFVAGRLALYLAVPPGYSTAIFPPAGIALAALLVFGPRLAPGVFLGSLLFTMQSLRGNLVDVSWSDCLSISAGVATGSTLQAIVGSQLVRRFVGLPLSLSRDEDIVKFQMLGGPASCVIAPTCGLASLYVGGAISGEDIVFNWFAWWVGDSVGVLIFAPLVMIAVAQPRAIWRSRWLGVGIPSLLTLGLVVVTYLYARDRDDENQQLQFEQRADTLVHALQRNFDGYVEVLQAIVSFYDSSGEVDRQEFHTFVANQIERHEGIQALEWIPRVVDEEREAFENHVREEGNRAKQPLLWAGLVQYAISERPADGSAGVHMVPAARRDEYYPVLFVEPVVGNERALGFDLGSDTRRLDALQRARNYDGPAATGPIRLVQSGSQRTGVLLVVPILAGGPLPAPRGARQAELQGYALGVFSVGRMVKAALGGLPRDDIIVKLYDETPAGDRQPLYAEVAGDQAAPSAVPSDNMTHSPMQTTAKYQFADRTWAMHFYAKPSYLAARRSWQTWAVLVGGLLFTGLLGAFMLVVTGKASQVEALVDERTFELTQANFELERSNADLQQFAYVTSHDLQEPLRAMAGFAQLLDQKYQDRMDEQGREYIEFVVDAAERMKALLEDLLIYSRVQTHGRSFEQVDCDGALDKALSNLSARIEESQAIVTRGDLPCLPADASQLVQLLQNLVGNAIKYRKREQPQVNVDAVRENGYWRFRVKDNGIGITNEHLDKIFVIFQRLHNRSQYSGTGIGLAICKRIVERHRGRIWVESEPDHGSNFYFTMPCGIVGRHDGDSSEV